VSENTTPDDSKLERIQGLADLFDDILPAHGTLEAVPLSKFVLRDLIDGVTAILSGESVGREVKTHAGDGLRSDFPSCGILYRVDRL
jgi:hypothetical protein